MMSTILDATNLDQTAGGQERIAALEAELARLKEQMALIIMQKEKQVEVWEYYSFLEASFLTTLHIAVLILYVFVHTFSLSITDEKLLFDLVWRRNLCKLSNKNL